MKTYSLIVTNIPERAFADLMIFIQQSGGRIDEISADVEAPPVKKSRTVEKGVKRERDGKTLVQHVMDKYNRAGEVTFSEVERFVRGLGYRAHSASATLSKLTQDGQISRVRKGVYEFGSEPARNSGKTIKSLSELPSQRAN